MATKQCASCNHYQHYISPLEEDQSFPIIIPTDRDMDNCACYLCNDEKGPCPIVKEEYNKIITGICIAQNCTRKATEDSHYCLEHYEVFKIIVGEKDLEL